MDQEGFIGVVEACKFLSVKSATLYSWKHKGMIPCYKPSGQKGLLLFKKSELEQFIQRGRVKDEQVI